MIFDHACSLGGVRGLKRGEEKKEGKKGSKRKKRESVELSLNQPNFPVLFSEKETLTQEGGREGKERRRR